MTSTHLKEAPEDLIFSLDIGTRTVVGTLSRKEEERYVILDHEMMAHPERAMYDGQIHDIEKVAKVARRIKETLESRNNIALSKVAIAAAGRALKTAKVSVAQELDDTREINKEIIDGVEMQAIQTAQREISPDGDKREIKYYCVGYTVMRYLLDDAMIINPKGHRGSELSVELIATFLPHIVVDSLYTVMSAIGLEVISMTLEPIAAINVAIPDNLRLLNLALVDVGAGTSDIAITKDGTIVSYGMVAMAGDELTETIAREYLLDFNTAEKVKMDLKNHDEVRFVDVIGMEHRVQRDEIMERVKPALQKLTGAIANAISEFNGRAPSAIFCIGGGCQIPMFTEMLAEAVDLPKERSVIKGTETIQNLHFECTRLQGPEFVTPIGIGYTAAKDKENDFLQVTVNDKNVRLFNSRELSVSDALVLVGFNARHLMPAKSEGYVIFENSVERRIYGGYGEPAKIYVNGAVSSLDTKLRNKDAVNIEPAIPGENIYYSIREIIKCPQVRFADKTVKLIANVKLNDEIVPDDRRVSQNDRITFDIIETVKQFREWHQISPEHALVVNGELVDEERVLKDKDKLETILVKKEKTVTVNIPVTPVHNAPVTQVHDVPATHIHDAPVSYGQAYDAPVRVAQSEGVTISGSASVMTRASSPAVVKDIEIPKVPASFAGNVSDQNDVMGGMNGAGVVSEIEDAAKPRVFHLVVNGKRMSIQHARKTMIFVDVFDHFHFDRSQAKGIVDLKLNGKRANYTDPLRDGDVLEIGWR